MGDYPGGIAIITEIGPDPNAPDIAFQVEHPTFGRSVCQTVPLEQDRLGNFGKARVALVNQRKVSNG